MHFPTLPAQTRTGSNVPLVSIILPVRNQAGTVSDCVSSLVGLEYSNKEIIVVDGGSTDGTQELVQKFAHEITLVDEEPLPVGWVGKNWACQPGKICRLSSGGECGSCYTCAWNYPEKLLGETPATTNLPSDHDSRRRKIG